MEPLYILNRIPQEYFLTLGKGESDITVHAGSFDRALLDAGIPNINIIVYSSILPPTAKEVKKIELPFGSVAEVIMSVCNGKKGEHVTAGLIYGWIYKDGQKIGGLVAEAHEQYTASKIRTVLNASLKDMFESRFDSRRFELKDVKMKIESFVPKKRFGTSIAAIVFKSYKYPQV